MYILDPPPQIIIHILKEEGETRLFYKYKWTIWGNTFILLDVEKLVMIVQSVSQKLTK